MTVFDPSRIAEDIAHMAADFERQAERFEQLRERMAALTATESSSDGRIAVSVNNNGVPTDIVLAVGTRGMDPAAVSAEIMSCMRRAQATLRAQVAETVQNTVGDDPAGAAIADQYAKSFPDVPAGDVPNYALPEPPASAPPQLSASPQSAVSVTPAPWESAPQPRNRKPDRDQVVRPDEPDEDDAYYNRKSWLV
ncbi:YbaB/EbfC family nucleoid-associated protein [Nocardia sp. bgisy134]|uniref:YbaB/EbfC family nucleoid-associated protein n=1 Tax=unclassified Nocardia TaxID=2637762 RepID=UPI003D71DF09